MRTIILLAGLGLAACNGDKTTATGDTGTTSDTSTTPITSAVAFNVTGTAYFLDQTPATEGLCASVVDPTPALGGGAPLTLVSGTVGAGGALSFTGVSTTSTIGLLIDIRDCATGTTVYPSATGIAYGSYSGLADGDTLANQTAFSLDSTTAAGFGGSATAAGYAGDLLADGFLIGFVFDATGTPVNGATVSCTGAGCTTPLYLDHDPVDGLFSTGNPPVANTATDALTNAGFVFPAAPIANYNADDGGTHTFTAQLNGSNPGIATFTAFYAN